MFKGFGQFLRKTPLEKIKPIKRNKYNSIGEITGNASIGFFEPVVPTINGVKRFFAKKPKDTPTNIIDKIQKNGKEVVTKKVLTEPLNKAVLDGIDKVKQNKTLSLFKAYGLNPVTAAAQNFGYDVGSLIPNNPLIKTVIKNKLNKN